jgi:membrane carboxypeptidase/penicillin-binding protein
VDDPFVNSNLQVEEDQDSTVESIKLETREHHQSTHYINREIPLKDIIEEFGTITIFERGLELATKITSSDDLDADMKLSDRVSDFIQEYDFERYVDEWTTRKGGYEVDEEIVKKFSLTSDR